MASLAEPTALPFRSPSTSTLNQSRSSPGKVYKNRNEDLERDSVHSEDVPWEAAPQRVADVQRGLKQRHLHMFALAGIIGTGLFLSSGKALAEAGPLGALIGYTIMGVVTAAVAYTAAEMSAFSPGSGGFVRHAHKFIEPGLGAVTGWNFWYSIAINGTVELVATSILVSYWAPHANIGILITVFWIPMVLINVGPVRYYGEVEFGFALLKITLIVVLLLVGLVITCGGSPTHESIGFRYWRDPGPLQQLKNADGHVIEGSWGRFLAVWSTPINAAFAYGNVQVVAIAGSETRQPRVAIPKAVSKTFTRVALFYVSSIFMIGLLLPSTEPKLLQDSGTAAQSPFVIAMNRARIRVLPDIVNAVVLSSAFSSGVSCIFIASRSLVGLAEDGNAPAIFARTNRLGNPYVAVLCSASFGALAYLAVTEQSMRVLIWLINLAAVAGLVSWIVLCVSYLRFYAAMKAQGYSRDELPYKSPLQPYTAWFALIIVSLITLFSGFKVFLRGNFSAADFLSSYINVFVFAGLYVVWKLGTRSHYFYHPAGRVDLSEFDEIRKEQLENQRAASQASSGRRSSRRQKLFLRLC